MFDPQSPQPPTRSDRRLPGAGQSHEPEQKRLMQTALVLLVACLAIVLYRDREFWFPDAGEDVAQQTLQGSGNATGAKQPEAKQTAFATTKVVTSKKLTGHQELRSAAPAENANSVPPMTVTRTVLPPLEVEVVAGNAHRTVRPGTNSLRVDLEADGGGQPQPAASIRKKIAPSITTNAAEHTAITPDPSDVVDESVSPGYPVLARQMKVQGSVILQALIGRDGLIQNVHVISGPPILASAAQEAVKQWHFKPHYEGSEAVETQAKITVNFVISTN